MQTDLFKYRVARRILFSLAIWGLLLLLSATQLHFSTALMEKAVREATWWLAIRRSLEEWCPWGFGALLLLFLGQHYPVERRSWWVRVIGLLGASAAITVLSLLAFAWLLSGQVSIEGHPFQLSKTFRELVVFYSVKQWALYLAVILAQHGWHYYRRSTEREFQTAALQTQLVQARLETLRMQLNPHFLFNTLNTISALIHEKPEDADRMVVRLSELLRLTLDGATDHKVPLARELALLERYLDIERIRFEDRLSVESKIDPNAMDQPVPFLILQPIVENAIRHGIEQRDEGGRIQISAELHHQRLHLSVTDNGPGLPQSERTALKEGIGLSNTRARLRHLYGDQHRLDLAPAEGGGLRVTMSIPC